MTIKVSILINNYNYGEFLKAAINSALHQTYKNCEVIVYDDQSTDNSRDILKQFGDKVLVIQGQGEKSEVHAFNQANAVYQAFLRSTGDIICLLDSDDLFLNDKVAQVVQAFENQPESQVIRHFGYRVDKHLKILGPYRLKQYTNYQAVMYQEKILPFECPTSFLSFRRGYLLKYFPMKHDTFTLMCLDFRACIIGTIENCVGDIDKALVYYRQHGKNDSLFQVSNPKKELKRFCQMYHYTNTFLKSQHLKPLYYFLGIRFWFSLFERLLLCALPRGIRKTIYNAFHGRLINAVKKQYLKMKKL